MKITNIFSLVLQVISILVFYLLNSNKTNAQFLNKDANWTVRLATYGDGLNEGFIDISIQKDSLINDVNYSLFEYSDDLFALREDSNKVIYKVLKHNFPEETFDTLEHILYDFNLTILR